ncbi:hypothetical protein HanRHA438_Chr05g0218201 [Helianthus annuus]|nr:hypothetical protein HanRHA438_Chr05g0218201 [Helianthus annuus]
MGHEGTSKDKEFDSDIYVGVMLGSFISGRDVLIIPNSNNICATQTFYMISLQQMVGTFILYVFLSERNNEPGFGYFCLM